MGEHELEILVDADACPVKDEIYNTAYRLGTRVILVANSYLRHPDHPLISMEVVSDGFDAADDRIVERASVMSLVVTSDILLAERALKKSATVLTPQGNRLTEDNIGNAIATRAIMADLRGGIEQAGGPPPFQKSDRVRFLNSLDRNLTAMLRASARSS